MAARYAEKIAAEVLADHMESDPDESPELAKMLADAAVRGYMLGFGARA